MTKRELTQLEKEFIYFFKTIQYFINNFKSFKDIKRILIGYIEIMDVVLEEYLDALSKKRQCFTDLDLLKFSTVCEEWYQNFDNEKGFFEAIRVVGEIAKKEKGKDSV